MTKHSDRKTVVRTYAAEHGVSYTAALRALAAAEEVSEVRPRLVLGIHREMDEHLRLPKPFFVHRNGMVRRQDHWRGEPYMLIGFEDPAVVGHEITVGRDEWFEAPSSAIGMQSVFMDRDRKWNTYPGLVDRISEESPRTADPDSALLRVTTTDGAVDASISVGHLLDHLVPDDVADAREHGWKDCEATTELLWLASISDDDGAAAAASAALDDRDDDEFTCHVTGPAVGAEPQ